MRGAVFVLSLLSVLSGACDNLASFRGEYNGAIVDGNFVRSCFPAKTTATIRFNPDLAVGDISQVPESQRNWITTSDHTFEQTVLEPVVRLAEDQLSQFDFPGPRRLRNYILLARPKQGPLRDRDATVVVSLLDNGRLEVRIIAQPLDLSHRCEVEVDAGTGTSKESDEPPPTSQYFGLFKLKSSS